MHFRRISILGVGLLGGSIGLAVRQLSKSVQIVGYGHRAATLERAKAIHAIDQATTILVEAVEGADLVILCTPVGLFESILKQIAPVLLPGAIVTDVGSTKRSVVALGQTLLGPSNRFVGSHPMAGSEKRGIEFAQADLFKNAACILTPTDRTDPEALARVETFWQELSVRTIRITPEDHDRQLAEVSHLPHALAAALVAIQHEPSLALAGKGFWDTTRIASGDAGLWRDIFLDNKDNLRAGLEKLKGEIDRLSSLLKKNDAEGLRRWLESVAQKRNGNCPKRDTGGE